MQRKITGKALKDVTNKMETCPTKFKPYWNGPRAAQSVSKESPNSRKADMAFGPVGLSAPTLGNYFPNGLSGPHSARPPDPAQSGYKTAVLPSSQIGASRQDNGKNGARASEKGDGEGRDGQPKVSEGYVARLVTPANLKYRLRCSWRECSFGIVEERVAMRSCEKREVC